MGVWNYDSLKAHLGHKVVVVGYEAEHEYENDPENVAVECETCGEVILDYDKEPEQPPVPETKPDEEVELSLKLTRSEWCELVNAADSKARHVEKGDYGEKDPEDGFDPQTWSDELKRVYAKISNVLAQAGVAF